MKSTLAFATLSVFGSALAADACPVADVEALELAPFFSTATGSSLTMDMITGQEIVGWPLAEVHSEELISNATGISHDR
ncbi:MAG: hypothetical protein RIC82_05985 [Parvibaculum sp.]